ncbi:MFS transporter, DHA1 family, bicyclomycin/chloramphenicol resistance protein [Roseomonas rosea]|uniref:Bcr/CflA family efflux transporter n=1 Tax=Muricoccus roseus TaxID=198092 RepID=A0A1M6E4A2_9PROT|nr:multidrug effflux MFS transporter [Roseomonas rosea]SHI80326.1 MFS transporter, DHA1 family, bicyclomycin/chloramphenicol resistance protein [Roseomonas rosea]
MPVWLPLLLGFLTAINPISTDMYLPAFPQMEAEFGSGPGSAQLTLATWFLGLAVGQIMQGTLSDRFGRRGPLMVGTVLYTAATIGCALAPDMGWLAAFRFVEAFGASASSVIPRAIVRDKVTGLEAARIMSRLILVMGAAPILAPSLGGGLLGVAGWRSIFWVMAGYGALSGLLVWWLLPDTLPPEKRLRLGPAALLRNFGRVLAEPVFLTHALMGAAVMFCIFAYISGAPAIYIEHFGITPGQFAIIFGGSAAGFIGGAQLNPLLSARFGPGRVLTIASLVLLANAGVLTLLAFTGWGGMWGFFPPVLIMLTASSLIMPNSAVGALARHGQRAGTASAMLGTLQFAVAAVGSMAVGALADGTPRPVAGVILFGGVLTLALNGLRRRYG